MIEIKKPVSIGENIIFSGEETKKGKIIIKKGTKIRSQEIGSLLESGFTEICVSKKPIIGVLSSGDELISPEKTLELGKIRDINTYTISNLINNSGGVPKIFPILPDDLNSQLNQAKKALQFCDMLIFSAGSSISYRDTTAEVINSLDKPGVIVHGISVKPGKPTILGLSGKKPIIGLPGNPVSSIMIFINIVKPILDKLNNHISIITKQIDCILTEDINSQTGREDYVQVSISSTAQKTLATPVFGKSNLINTLVNSDGFITIPPETGGLYKNSLVKVKTYE
jgi:molybdopterin molybdotransferase